MTFLIVAVVAAAIALITSIALAWWDSRKDPTAITDRHIFLEAAGGDRARAIRWYRKRYGGSVREAREAVDRIAKGGPRGN